MDLRQQYAAGDELHRDTHEPGCGVGHPAEHPAVLPQQVGLTQAVASEHLRGGYPNRYVPLARDVLPLIGADDIAQDDWVRDMRLHQDRIAACPPEQAVTIEVWDLS